MAKKIITQGGGNNLFKVTGSNNLEIYVVKDGGGLFGRTSQIGKAKNLEDALSIIKSYSGHQIKEIKEW